MPLNFRYADTSTRISQHTPFPKGSFRNENVTMIIWEFVFMGDNIYIMKMVITASAYHIKFKYEFEVCNEQWETQCHFLESHSESQNTLDLVQNLYCDSKLLRKLRARCYVIHVETGDVFIETLQFRTFY